MNISTKQQAVYEAMTPTELLEAITRDDKNSQQALWFLLHIKFKESLHQAFIPYENNLEPKTFEDLLSDLFIYIYNYKPSKALNDVHYYVLQRNQDSISANLSHYIVRIFKRMINSSVKPDQEIKKGYNKNLEQVDERAHLEKMHRLAYAIVVVSNKSTNVDRYILFRELAKIAKVDRILCDIPPIKELAELIGLTYGTYRTRLSRLMSNVKTIAIEQKITDGDLRKLDEYSIDMINRISGKSTSEYLTNVLYSMLMFIERTLPSTVYESICSIRSKAEQVFVEEDTNVLASAIITSTSFNRYMDYSPAPRDYNKGRIQFTEDFFNYSFENDV